MAIVVETLVRHATKDEADRLNDGISAAIGQMGGPPPGLMVHFTRPAGDGFILCNIWRGEADMQPFYDEVILPHLANQGLDSEKPSVAPVWTLARP